MNTQVLHRRRVVLSCGHGHGFTLLEVLVVVSVIALLVAVLIPGLKEAREHARRSVCLSNTGQLARGVVAFSLSHKGRGQLYADWGYVDKADPGHSIYAYQNGWMDHGVWASRGTPFLKAWPVAYAPDLGISSLKYTHQYFLDETVYLTDYPASDEPEYHFKRFGRHDVFFCPSDRFSIRETNSPEHVYGVLSYAINEDVFGVSGRTCHSSTGPRDQLRGSLDRVVRPSEVAFFTDTGHETLERMQALKSDGKIKIMAGGYVPTWFCSDQGAPYLDQVNARTIVAVPVQRHGGQGGISVACADGHGTFVTGTGGWQRSIGFPVKHIDDNILVPKGYRPRAPRVTPYNP
jgi:prepilin-type N-terminal cleavage/methylation domain-containing protein